MLPKTIYRFIVILIKLPMTVFTELENNPRIYMESLKTQNCQSNGSEKEQSRRHNSSRLQRILYKATVIKRHGIGTKADIRMIGEYRAQK